MWNFIMQTITAFSAEMDHSINKRGEPEVPIWKIKLCISQFLFWTNYALLIELQLIALLNYSQRVCSV